MKGFRFAGLAVLLAGCGHEVDGPSPRLSTIDPDLVCGEQLTTTVTITGEGLSPLALDALTDDPRLALPAIRLTRVLDVTGEATADEPFAVPDDPGDPAASQVHWTSQISMTFEVSPELGLAPGIYDVTVENRNGKSFTAEQGLRVTPPPTALSVQPDLLCSAQHDNVLTITGTAFLSNGRTLPTVTIGDAGFPADSLDGCSDFGPDARLCTSLTVTVPEGGLPDGAHAVHVTNPEPAACQTLEDLTLAVVPPPQLSAVDPDVLCTEQEDNQITLTGSGFLSVDGVLPTVTIGDLALAADAVSDCQIVDGTLLDAQTCNTLEVTVPQGSLAVGQYDVRVTNPAPADCTSVEAVTIAVVPAPVLDTVEPDLVCTAQGDNVLTLAGSGFLSVDGALPTVTIDGTAFGADSVADCLPVEGTLTDSALCNLLEVTIPQGGLPEGAFEVVVTNPDPAACSSTSVVTIAVVPPPTISGIVPSPLCNAQVAAQVMLQGSGFLVVDGVNPTVFIDGSAVSVLSVDDCSDVDGTTLDAQSCNSVRIELEAGSLAPGPHDVTAENPAPAGCVTATPFVMTVTPPPDITGVAPSVACAGGVLTIFGTDFSASPTVVVGNLQATVLRATPTEIEVTLDPALALGGPYDVEVDNGDGCNDVYPGAVIVTAGPAVYFVDPPVVYSGIATQSTVYVSGLAAEPASVTIRPSGGGGDVVLDTTWDPARPNRILATVPAGLATGDWDVIVDDGAGCSALLLAGISITDTLTVAIESIDPPFGWTLDDTAVTITAIDPAPAGMVQFDPTPRVYLNPDVVGPGTVATALQAVAWADRTRLTAVVPAGLPSGLYDLIVVNPDGTVGLLDAAFTVTADIAPPPTITTITPGSVINAPAQAVTIQGTAFRDPSVAATCVDEMGVVTVVDGVVGSFSDTSIDVAFDMSALLGGAVCVLRVTNDDGTFVDFSALAVTNPAQNLPATIPDDSMVVPRRGLSSTAGRVTSQARYVYAIGGDDGTDPGLLSSVEAAPVDLFGDLGTWSVLPSTLPEGRSLSGAVTVGRFIYLVAGRTPGGATSSVLRTQILDPRDAPEIADLALEFADAPGLDPGLFYYRVSAVMADDDPSNPGGETLASDPLNVIVPPAPDKVHATIFWTAVPGADRYRVYRTPAPDQLLGDVTLIAEVPAAETSYLDAGAVAIPGTPLPLGALGAWHEVGPLVTAREGPAVTVAPDPDTPASFFLYAIGGRDGPGNALRSYDVASITVAIDGSQTVGAFSEVAGFLTAGRWQLAGLAMDHERASLVPAGDVWVYAMSGFSADQSAIVTDVTAGLVTGDGTLSPVYEVDDTRSRAGTGFAGANNFLFVFGGTDVAGPTSSAFSAKICDGTGPCAGGEPDPPDLRNWNALGFGLQQERYLPGSALESAFIFLSGGASGGAAATATTERTHW